MWRCFRNATVPAGLEINAFVHLSPLMVLKVQLPWCSPDHSVWFDQGSALSCADLKAVNVQDCAACVILSSNTPISNNPSLVDTESILATLNVRSMEVKLSSSSLGKRASLGLWADVTKEEGKGGRDESITCHYSEPQPIYPDYVNEYGQKFISASLAGQHSPTSAATGLQRRGAPALLLERGQFLPKALSETSRFPVKRQLWEAKWQWELITAALLAKACVSGVPIHPSKGEKQRLSLEAWEGGLCSQHKTAMEAKTASAQQNIYCVSSFLNLAKELRFVLLLRMWKY